MAIGSRGVRDRLGSFLREECRMSLSVLLSPGWDSPDNEQGTWGGDKDTPVSCALFGAFHCVVLTRALISSSP